MGRYSFSLNCHFTEGRELFICYAYLAFTGYLCSQVDEQHFIPKVSMFSSFVCHMAHKEIKLQAMGRVFKTSALGSWVQL